MRRFKRLTASFLRHCRNPYFPVALAVLGCVFGNLFRPFLKPILNHSEVRIPVFIALVILAVKGSRHAAVRVGFATALLFLMALVAMKYGERFPFESWNLYKRPSPVEQTADFIDVVTESGAAYRLDWKVLGDFTTPTNHVRLGKRVVNDMTPEQRREFAQFVVKRVHEYRAERVRYANGWEKWLRMLRFPPHQFGSRWSEEDLAALEHPTSIRIRTETLHLDEHNAWKPRVTKQQILEVPCF